MARKHNRIFHSSVERDGVAYGPGDRVEFDDEDSLDEGLRLASVAEPTAGDVLAYLRDRDAPDDLVDALERFILEADASANDVERSAQMRDRDDDRLGRTEERAYALDRIFAKNSPYVVVHRDEQRLVDREELLNGKREQQPAQQQSAHRSLLGGGAL